MTNSPYPSRRSSGRRTEDVRRKKAAKPRAESFRGKMRSQHRADTTMPPVMVRGPLTGTIPVERKRVKKVRRRYDVPLPSVGAEMRLPALPRLAIGWRIVSGVLVAALAFLIYTLLNSPSYYVQDAQLSGLQRLTPREVNQVLDVAGQSIFNLNTEHVQQELLQAFPEFSSVAVAVTLPNKVDIKITERKPLLSWHQGENMLLVDADGVAFPLRGNGKPAPNPIVEASALPPSGDPQVAESAPAPQSDLDALTLKALSLKPPDTKSANNAAQKQPAAKQPSLAPKHLMTPDMVKAVLVLAKQAPQDTPLVYNAQHGLGWKDGSGWEVYFGDASDVENKLRVYQAIVRQLQAEQVQPVLISVEFEHAPYYRTNGKEGDTTQ